MEQIIIGDVEDIGRAIRSARNDQGLTQQEFADIAGVGVRFLSEVERGKSSAEVGLVLRVLTECGFDVMLEKRRWSGHQSRVDTSDETPPAAGSAPDHSEAKG